MAVFFLLLASWDALHHQFVCLVVDHPTLVSLAKREEARCGVGLRADHEDQQGDHEDLKVAPEDQKVDLEVQKVVPGDQEVDLGDLKVDPEDQGDEVHLARDLPTAAMASTDHPATGLWHHPAIGLYGL